MSEGNTVYNYNLLAPGAVKNYRLVPGYAWPGLYEPNHWTQRAACTPGKTYTLSTIPNVYGEVCFGFYLEDGSVSRPNGYEVFSAGESVVRTLTAPAGAKYVAASWADGNRRPMLVEGSTPAAWAPAEGEILTADGGGGMTEPTNLVKTQPDETATHTVKANGGHTDFLKYALGDRNTKLSANTSFHIGITIKPDKDIPSGHVWAWISYHDDAGAGNFANSSAISYVIPAGVWTRLEWTVTVPAGMILWSSSLSIDNLSDETKFQVTNFVVYPLTGGRIVRARGTTALVSVSDGAKGDTGTGVSAIVEQYYLSTSNSSQTGGSWSTTCPAWQSGHYIWTRSQITWTNGTTTYTTPVLANGLNSANSEAKNATTIANGKNKVTYSATANPSGTSGYSAGDIWFNKSTGGIWQFDGSKWNLHQVGTTSIANGAITADKVAANAINAQKINVDALSAISANLGSITAGDINGVTIKGSRFIGSDFVFADSFPDKGLKGSDGDNKVAFYQYSGGNPITVHKMLLLSPVKTNEDFSPELRCVLSMDEKGNIYYVNKSGAYSFGYAVDRGSFRFLNKNGLGNGINSVAIGSEKEHAISFGWTGSRLRPVIDGNQIYMPVIDTIFYDPNNGMGSGVSLTSAATNYDALDIFCKTDDGVQLYTKVCNPAVGTTFEVSVNHMQAGGGHMWLKTKQFIIDGASHISTAQSGANWYTGILRIDSNSTPTAVSVGDYITIIKVVGWKY